MFDVRRALRRIKPHRHARPFRRRPKDELSFVAEHPTSGPELVLDTCVYIDVLQGATPDNVDTLLRLRTCNHLAHCIAELTHGVGRLDPSHPGTAAITQAIAGVVDAVPPHRLAAPTADVVLEAGILSGLIFRMCDLSSGKEVAALNDAVLYLHALANGLTGADARHTALRRDEPGAAGRPRVVLRPERLTRRICPNRAGRVTCRPERNRP